jgi:hypothetical protein
MPNPRRRLCGVFVTRVPPNGPPGPENGRYFPNTLAASNALGHRSDAVGKAFWRQRPLHDGKCVVGAFTFVKATHVRDEISEWHYFWFWEQYVAAQFPWLPKPDRIWPVTLTPGLDFQI